jgi:hypothetical protein
MISNNATSFLLRPTLLSTVASAALVFSAGTSAAEFRVCRILPCEANQRGKMQDNSSTEKVETGQNTEVAKVPEPDDAGFSVSVDGEQLVGEKPQDTEQRKTDLALESVDIQVKFDGLDAKPVLNVSTYPIRQVYQPGETVQFLASNNYPTWIKKSEIRIFTSKQPLTEKPYAVVPVTSAGAGVWTMEEMDDNFIYVLRVYDADGRFDETVPLFLQPTAKSVVQNDNGAVAPGYGDDRTAFRNIPVDGGAITISGRNVPNGNKVTILGDNIPIDESNAFVVQRILPPGDHNVDVAVQDENAAASGLLFNRSVNIPETDWFYAALADFTFGRRFGSKDIELVKPADFKDSFTKGRLAFYVKGKIKGQYLLTAAADTGEAPLKSIFQGLDAKDPKQFLRRIDPDAYYPVYGDDSTSIDDAPTRGKFYVKLARGDSHVKWGTFKTEINGTEYLRNERALYGASAVYKSEGSTSTGERTSQVKVYAAQPGTLPQRDELRGTGGSSYFLKHHDITIGSETITVEIRDKVTGRVLDRRSLQSGRDFDIDYLQGVVILRTPLNSVSANDTLVRDTALGGNDVFLIANYEYSPAASEVNGYVFGGRAQQWLGDNLRVGVTGANEKTGTADQKILGADIQLRASDRTYIEYELANSQGPGFGNSYSADGGLTISDVVTAGVVNKSAKASRLHARVDLEDLRQGPDDEGKKGDLELYYEHKDAGFSTLSQQITSTTKNGGAKLHYNYNDTWDTTISYDEQSVASGKNDIDANAQIEYKIDPDWAISGGIKESWRVETGGINAASRTDAAAKISYLVHEESAIYLFGQTTLRRSGPIRRNDRLGLGADLQLSDEIAVALESSYGTTGWGAAATWDYKPAANDHYYLGYRLDPDRETKHNYSSLLNGDNSGEVVVGMRHAYNEQASVYAEDSYGMFGLQRSLMQTYGVVYTPDENWTVGGGIESGSIWDESINATTGLKNSDFDRTAFSASTAYRSGEGFLAHAKGEIRLEDSTDHTRKLNSMLIDTGADIRMFNDWRVIGNLEAVISEASLSTRSGRYVEASLGYAYRPIDNDRLNALLKYTFLYDLPGADQVTINGVMNGPSQISNIISVDMNYDINDILTLGAKYGMRVGETKERTGPADWIYDSAQLGIVRLDMHIVKNWDVLAEARVLTTGFGDTSDFGYVSAVYRQMGDNFKVGLGYNFGHFSDDLRNITADDHGVFINAIGKF